jgi:hypothetical protein
MTRLHTYLWDTRFQPDLHVERRGSRTRACHSVSPGTSSRTTCAHTTWGTTPSGKTSPSVVDRDVAEEAPRPNLDLGTVAGLHVDALIPEERGPAGGYPGTRGNVQSDVADQVEDAQDGSLTGRSGAQVQPHIANKDHDLLIGPSDWKGTLGHIAQQREHSASSRRATSGAGAPDPEPGGRGSQKD